MSVYSELVRIALAADYDESGSRALADLVARAVSLRVALLDTGDPSARIASAVAYDVALARVCDRAGVRHDLTGDRAGPDARHQAELHLLEHMPSLGTVLAVDEAR
jgi:hypothetical protein